MSDQERIENTLEAWNRERRQMLASLPMPLSDFRDLLDYLGRDDAPECDNTLRETIAFLEERQLDVETVLEWIEETVGSCDCEVVANADGLFGDLIEC